MQVNEKRDLEARVTMLNYENESLRSKRGNFSPLISRDVSTGTDASPPKSHIRL